MTVDGQTARLRNPVEAVRRGIALVPEDRRAHGVALDLGIRENLTLASLGRLSRWGWLDRSAERRRALDLIGALQIKAGGPDAPVRTLSGGNQQKVALGKWLARRRASTSSTSPRSGRHRRQGRDLPLIAEAAERGAGILLLSADPDELLGLCDRILVLFRGTIVAEHAAAGTDAGTLLQASLTAAEWRWPVPLSAVPTLAAPALRPAQHPDRAGCPGRRRPARRRQPPAEPGGADGLRRAGAVLSGSDQSRADPQSAVLGILSLGLTLVLITGGTDVIAGASTSPSPGRSASRPPCSRA